MSTPKGRKRKRLETLAEKEKKEKKEHQTEEKLREKYRREGWALMEPSQWAFKRCVEGDGALYSPFVFPKHRRTTRFDVFQQMWSLFKTIPRRIAEKEKKNTTL